MYFYYYVKLKIEDKQLLRRVFKKQLTHTTTEEEAIIGKLNKLFCGKTESV